MIKFIKKLFKRKQRIINYPVWINIEDGVPPLFKNVLVIGSVKNEFPRMHIGRRWTGYNQRKKVEKEKIWDWLTENDYTIKGVKKWYPIPNLLLPEYIEDEQD